MSHTKFIAAAPAPTVAQPTPSRQPLDPHMVMGSIPAPLVPAEPPATDDLDDLVRRLMNGDHDLQITTIDRWMREGAFAITALRAENERQAREIADARAKHMTAEGRLDSVSLMLAGADVQIEKLVSAVAFHERNALRAEAERDALREALLNSIAFLRDNGDDDATAIVLNAAWAAGITTEQTDAARAKVGK